MKSVRWVSLGLCCLALASGAVRADDGAVESVPLDEPAPAPAAVAVQDSVADADANVTQLEDVVVTATKRAQTSRDIPTTINVLNGEKLEAMGARQLKDFVDLIPGVKLAEAAAGAPEKIAVRGVGPDDTTNQTVAVVLGDVPMTDPYSNLTQVDPDPWDLSTVEVLKGPQGTLFGASSLNGIIRYVPAPPELERWEAKGFIDWLQIKEGGSEPTYGVAVNAPLGETAALRVSGVRQRLPGVIDYVNPRMKAIDGDGVSKWSGRMMALWQPLDALTINAMFMRQSKEGDELSFVTNQDGRLERRDAPGPSPFQTRFSVATLDARYAFDWATLVSLTGYQTKMRNFVQEGSYFAGEAVAEAGVQVLEATQLADARGFLQELRLVSNDDGPWSWIGGGFMSSYSAHLYADEVISNTDGLAPLRDLLPFNLGTILFSDYGVSVANLDMQPLEASEQALFGEVSRTFGSWKLLLGGRFYRTQIDGTETFSGVVADAASAQVLRSESVSVSSAGFSPKASLTYKPGRDFLAYATASRGFQYGGVNFVPFATDRVDPTFESSTLWNYEAGVRTDWLERTLRMDLTAFFIDWSNAQVSQYTQPYNDLVVSNVGAVRNRGVEWTLRYLPGFLPGLSLETTGSYTMARTAAPFVGINNQQVEPGTEMPNCPPLQTASTVGFLMFLPRDWTAQTALVYVHQDPTWSDITHSHELNSRDMLNYQLSLSRRNSAWSPSLTLQVNNLTDARRIVSIRNAAGTTTLTNTRTENAIPTLYSTPRSVSLRLAFQF